MPEPAAETSACADRVPATWTGWWGVLGLVTALLAVRGRGLDADALTLVALAATALPMAIHDAVVVRPWRRPSAGLDRPVEARRFSAGRVAIKLIGLGAAAGLVGGAWWLLPEYHGDFYDPGRSLAWSLLPWLLPAAPLYVAWTDRRMADPHDGLWHLGALLLRRPQAAWRDAGRHLGGWAVKGFFLPLMVVYLQQNLVAIDRGGAWPQDFVGWFDAAWLWLYTVDVAFATTGYLATLRLLDTHVRSTEPTAGGWLVCLACYQPFWSLFDRHYLGYDDRLSWIGWLADLPWLQAAWGTAILLLTAVYVWATVSFGLRFSNLTHRGIIGHGPYRWLRHPAYVAKNLSWWLVAVPFVAGGGVQAAVRQCGHLLLLNGVYALRAWTEERHLGRDPAYRAYRQEVARRKSPA